MDWKASLRAAFERAGYSPDPDILEELAQHAASLYEQCRADGQSRAQAQVAVEAQIAVWAREGKSMRRRILREPVVLPPPAHTSWLTGVVQDARYALRLIARRPGSTVVAALTMALGIGATTVLFSIVSGVLLKPLPWPEADRLVTIFETREGSTRAVMETITNGTYLAWKENAQTIEGLAGWGLRRVTMSGAGEPQRVRIAAVTASLFPLLGARPALGAPFTAADEPAGNYVVISHGVWTRQFGGREDAIGKSLLFDGQPHTIVAVMPPEFVFPDPDTVAWVPRHVPLVVAQDGKSRTISMFGGIARLRTGATAAQAAQEATARGRQAPDPGMTAVAVFGSRGPVVVSAAPMVEAMTAEVRPALVVFLAAVGLLLATATANVASVQLARATSRRRELAIRAAIGAGAGRIGRQLLVESLITGSLGCAAGLLLAYRLHHFLPSLLPADFPRIHDVTLNGWVVLFAIAISIIASLLFGCLPALQARRLDVVAALAEDGLAPSGGWKTSTARARLLIMTGQVATAAVLLIGASLLVRSFNSLLNVDRGYDVNHVLTARLPLPDGAFNDRRRFEIVDAVVARLAGVPGVLHAASTTVLPLLGSEATLGFQLPAEPGSGQQPVQVRAGVRTVSTDYFKALGIRVVEGRGFAETDTAASLPVVVVNREFARRYLQNQALGRRLPTAFDNARPEWQIVGVIDNILPRDVTQTIQPEIFVPGSQLRRGLAVTDPIVVVRTAGNPVSLASVLRDVVRQQDPNLVPDSIMTMDERLRSTLARPRLFAVVLTLFALFALTIAGVGLFGVLSYSVAQRAREIGIRSALGARRGDIVRLVMKQGATVIASGLAIGIAAAFVLARSISGLLYGISSTDVPSFTLVPLLLAIIAAAACIVPARRAASVDPLKVLRR